MYPITDDYKSCGILERVHLWKWTRGLVYRDTSIVLAGGFADGEVVKVVHGEGVSCLEELESTQEEADTRLLQLHSMGSWF